MEQVKYELANFKEYDGRDSDSNEEAPQPKQGKKTRGRVKIEMQFIENKLRRYTTFSKRKSGIMKKAHELATLTGTQVMLLVASETGHVYTFATKKLQPMLSTDRGKQLIQTCLNAPDRHGNDDSAADQQRMSAQGCEETELMFGSADEDSLIKGEVMNKDVKMNPDIIAAINKNTNHQQQSSTSANHPIDLVQKCRAREAEETRGNYEESPKIFQKMKTVSLFQDAINQQSLQFPTQQQIFNNLQQKQHILNNFSFRQAIHQPNKRALVHGSSPSNHASSPSDPIIKPESPTSHGRSPDNPCSATASPNNSCGSLGNYNYGRNTPDSLPATSEKSVMSSHRISQDLPQLDGEPHRKVMRR